MSATLQTRLTTLLHIPRGQSEYPRWPLCRNGAYLDLDVLAINVVAC